METKFYILAVTAIIIDVIIWGTIGYVAWHFIEKFW